MESTASRHTAEPYSVLNRKERSRELAQKRRTTYKSLMKDLAEELPFSKDVISQVDYNSRLRLALCFFQMKSLAPKKNDMDEDGKELQSANFHRGLLQDLLTESLDGFLIVMSSSSNLVYISESIHKHLGLFQSEHIGLSLYELIHEEDHNSVKKALVKAETRVLSKAARSVECSFFCRMKCSRFKVSNTATKCPGYKLVFISGHYKIQGSEPCLFAIVRPVSPPSILEITMEGNMFVTHYNLEMKCIFFDGRLRHLMGYEKQDLINHVPFEFHHHDDVEANLECSRGLMEKGEGLSGYYRYMSKYGQFVWVQSRATMMFDSRTGQPSYIVCMNFVISREKGEKALELRKAVTAGDNPSNIVESTRSHDPFPVPRGDGKSLNPFDSLETSVDSPMSGSAVPLSPASLRSISPDSTQQVNHVSTSSSRSSPDSFKSRDVPSIDRGYHSTSHDSLKSSSVVSPASSFVDSAIGSPETFSDEPKIKVESYSPSPLQNNSGRTDLVSLLTTDMPHAHPASYTGHDQAIYHQTTLTHMTSPQMGYPPTASTFPHKTMGFPRTTSSSQAPSFPSQATSMHAAMASSQMPFPVPQETFPQPRAALQTMFTPMHRRLPYIPPAPGQHYIGTELLPRQTEDSYLPLQLTASAHPQYSFTAGFVAQVIPQHTNMLPVLNAEDVQFLDSAKADSNFCQ